MQSVRCGGTTTSRWTETRCRQASTWRLYWQAVHAGYAAVLLRPRALSWRHAQRRASAHPAWIHRGLPWLLSAPGLHSSALLGAVLRSALATLSSKVFHSVTRTTLVPP